MYKNVGRDIKNLASFMVVLYTIGFGLIGMMAGNYLGEQGAVIGLCIFGGIVGFVAGYFKKLYIYAYGDMADNLQRIREMLESARQKEAVVREEWK